MPAELSFGSRARYSGTAAPPNSTMGRAKQYARKSDGRKAPRRQVWTKGVSEFGAGRRFDVYAPPGLFDLLPLPLLLAILTWTCDPVLVYPLRRDLCLVCRKFNRELVEAGLAGLVGFRNFVQAGKTTHTMRCVERKTGKKWGSPDLMSGEWVYANASRCCGVGHHETGQRRSRG
eukprot:SAG31_NODE_929_length_10926_cov_8.162834_1_plen_175_part_00